MEINQDNFNLLRKISKKPDLSQRKLALELGFSLGKLNYCLKALKNKGLVKIKNFKKNPNKINYIYILTPSGIEQKTKLTINFMQKKMKEYQELKNEIEKQYFEENLQYMIKKNIVKKKIKIKIRKDQIINKLNLI